MGEFINYYLALARGIPSNCARNANVIWTKKSTKPKLTLRHGLYILSSCSWVRMDLISILQSQTQSTSSDASFPKLNVPVNSDVTILYTISGFTA